MNIRLATGAIEAWRRGRVVMTGPIDVTLPHWPATMRGLWIESTNPETHRVAGFVRDLCPADAQWMLGELDALLRDGQIELVQTQEDDDAQTECRARRRLRREGQR